MLEDDGRGQGAVTRLLKAWEQGDAVARNELMPLVYRELRQRAAAYLRRERAGRHTTADGAGAPSDRWQTSEALLDALRGLPAGVGNRRRWGRWVAAAAALTAAGVLVWAALGTGNASGSRRTIPTTVIGNMRQLTLGEGLESDPTLSPDGKFVAYAGGNASHVRVYIRAFARWVQRDVSGRPARQC